MAQVVQHLACIGLLLGVANPHLGQALVRWQLTRRARQVLPLHAGFDAASRDRLGPERGDGKVGGLCEAQHRMVFFFSFEF